MKDALVLAPGAGFDKATAQENRHAMSSAGRDPVPPPLFGGPVR